MNMDTIILLRTHMCKKYEKNSDRIPKDKNIRKEPMNDVHKKCKKEN